MPNDSLTPEQIEALKSEHGPELRTVETADGSGLFVFRKPTQPEWHRFVDAVSSDDKRSSKYNAQKMLAASCCVWPSRTDWNAAVDERPGLVQIAAGEIADMSGAAADTVTGKL